MFSVCHKFEISCFGTAMRQILLGGAEGISNYVKILMSPLTSVPSGQMLFQKF